MSEELDFDGSVIVELLLSFLKSDKVKYDSIGSKLGVMSVLDALGSDLDEGNYEATPEAYVVYKDFKDLLDEDDEEVLEANINFEIISEKIRRALWIK